MHSITQLLSKYGLHGIGKNEGWESNSIHENKTVILTNQITLLIMVICLTFSIFDYFNSIRDSQLFYAPLALLAVLGYFINRKGWHLTAKHILITSSLLTTFFFSQRAAQETFVTLMYFPVIIGSFALFGYRHLWAGIFYFCVSLLLFFLDINNIISINNPEFLSESMVINTRAINYFITSFTLVFLIIFILSINHQTEEKIKEQNEELLKTNNELDKFVYSTSHDLRAPLMSILGLVKIAEIEQDKSKMDECLKLVEDRVHTLDNFITEIIDISRNKKSGLQLSAFKVSESINKILDDFRYLEEFEKIEFQLDISDDLEIKSDKIRFNLIMRNLISNAIKYHNYMLEKPKILISCQSEEFTLKVKVIDNGFGIDEKHQSKLFDMFFRGTQNGKGTGLGLYIVQETALKMDGKITLDSTVGKGSTFELEIPTIHENGA